MPTADEFRCISLVSTVIIPKTSEISSQTTPSNFCKSLRAERVIPGRYEACGEMKDITLASVSRNEGNSAKNDTIVRIHKSQTKTRREKIRKQQNREVSFFTLLFCCAIYQFAL